MIKARIAFVLDAALFEDKKWRSIQANRLTRKMFSTVVLKSLWKKAFEEHSPHVK
jgi:hypothetical protein